MIDVLLIMNRAFNKLSKVQEEIHSNSSGNLHDEYRSMLMFCDMSGLIKIKFYCDLMGEFDALNSFLQILVDSDVSPYIKSVEFSGPDEGANGTKPWNFGAIVNSDALFPSLTSFLVESTQPQDHNCSIVSGNFYEENGMIAELIRKMPNLLSLSVPSAPNQKFFHMKQHHLNILTVQAGYDTQDFIFNLSKSSCFPKLRHLDFTDFQETYIDDYESHCTPHSHYKELFLSSGLPELRSVVLRNPLCSREEIKELKALRKDVSIKLIRTSNEYL